MKWRNEDGNNDDEEREINGEMGEIENGAG